jgi:CHRD domain
METAMIHTSVSHHRRRVRAVPFAMLVMVATSLQAEQTLSILLSGAAEVPRVLTSASANGKFVVLPDRTISGSISVSGMVPTMADIHEAPVGKNGPPIITLTRSPDASYAVPAGTRLNEAQYLSYMAGKLYVNVHSPQYPDGEIRAQLPGKPMRLAN